MASKDWESIVWGERGVISIFFSGFKGFPLNPPLLNVPTINNFILCMNICLKVLFTSLYERGEIKEYIAIDQNKAGFFGSKI